MEKEVKFCEFWKSLSGKDREKFRCKLGRKLANKKIQKRIQADEFMKITNEVFGHIASKETEEIIREIFLL